MAVLSFIMIGKALHSIQEAGKISITDLPINFRVDLLGVFPTAETLLAQFAVITLIFALWWSGKKPQLVKA